MFLGSLFRNAPPPLPIPANEDLNNGAKYQQDEEEDDDDVQSRHVGAFEMQQHEQNQGTMGNEVSQFK